MSPRIVSGSLIPLPTGPHLQKQVQENQRAGIGGVFFPTPSPPPISHGHSELNLSDKSKSNPDRTRKLEDGGNTCCWHIGS